VRQLTMFVVKSRDNKDATFGQITLTMRVAARSMDSAKVLVEMVHPNQRVIYIHEIGKIYAEG
jgi:hypothetical protein